MLFKLENYNTRCLTLPAFINFLFTGECTMTSILSPEKKFFFFFLYNFAHVLHNLYDENVYTGSCIQDEFFSAEGRRRWFRKLAVFIKLKLSIGEKEYLTEQKIAVHFCMCPFWDSEGKIYKNSSKQILIFQNPLCFVQIV